MSRIKPGSIFQENMKICAILLGVSTAFAVDPSPDGKDWMSLFADEPTVGELPLIPGTNSVIRFHNNPGIPTCRGCPYFSYERLRECAGLVNAILESGTRFFDFYLTKSMMVRDSDSTEFQVPLEEVFKGMQRFLRAYPTEVIFLSLQLQVPAQAAAVATWLNGYPEVYQRRTTRRLRALSLNEVRGRIVVICDQDLKLADADLRLNYNGIYGIAFERLHGAASYDAAKRRIENYVDAGGVGVGRTMRGLRLDYYYQVGIKVLESADNAQKKSTELAHFLRERLENIPMNPFLGFVMMNFNCNHATTRMIQYITRWARLRNSVLLNRSGAALAQALNDLSNVNAVLALAEERARAASENQWNGLQPHHLASLFAITIVLFAALMAAIVRQ